MKNETEHITDALPMFGFRTSQGERKHLNHQCAYLNGGELKTNCQRLYEASVNSAGFGS